MRTVVLAFTIVAMASAATLSAQPAQPNATNPAPASGNSLGTRSAGAILSAGNLPPGFGQTPPPPPTPPQPTPPPTLPPPPPPPQATCNLALVQSLLDQAKSALSSCSGASGCNLSQWSNCTCKTPAMFTTDGRGNCNVGATKADAQVWCYVSDVNGSPTTLCPDAQPSSNAVGLYWSRFACITP